MVPIWGKNIVKLKDRIGKTCKMCGKKMVKFGARKGKIYVICRDGYDKKISILDQKFNIDPECTKCRASNLVMTGTRMWKKERLIMSNERSEMRKENTNVCQKVKNKQVKTKYI